MNRFFTLLLDASCLTAVGQVPYPYNPDGNADSLIGASDIQDLLSGYGLPFSPSEILVDGQTLTTVLTQLQNSIDSLSGLGGSGGSVLDMPLGTVLPIATESVPEGWMLCDGREISIEEYQGLYDLIGTTYGAGDSAFWAQVFFPATTFNIPDLRGRTIIGANDMGGEPSSVLQAHQASFGQLGGEEFHLLTELELPAHTHDVEYFRRTTGGYSGDPWHGTADNYATNGAPQWVKPSGVRASGGGGDQPHNNMQPYMALNYMIKVQVAEDVILELQEAITELENSVISFDLSQYFFASSVFTNTCLSEIFYDGSAVVIWDVLPSCNGSNRELRLEPGVEGQRFLLVPEFSSCSVTQEDSNGGYMGEVTQCAPGVVAELTFIFGRWRSSR